MYLTPNMDTFSIILMLSVGAIGFLAGYVAREAISHHRRVNARRQRHHAT
jgi:hypothetical protein